MTYTTSLHALSDPTRRALFQKLLRRERSVGDLAKSLCVSQPAVSQHLAVLRKARLVRGRRDGTRHFFTATPRGLASLKRWLESLLA